VHFNGLTRRATGFGGAGFGGSTAAGRCASSADLSAAKPLSTSSENHEQ
jgi:hypothetical protein